jgi:hypothetical protein
MKPIEAALAAMESLEPRESFSCQQLAAHYGCSHSALGKRHQGVSSSYSTKAAEQQALHPHQEQELLQYIKLPTERGLAPTQAMIRRFGSDIAKRELGKNRVDRYIKQHKVDLISRWAMGIDRLRHQADSQSKYSLYFKLLRSKISQYNVDPCHRYNMDEKGFMLGVLVNGRKSRESCLY